MTFIRILAGVLVLSALAESAIVDRWEYREVYFEKFNETIKDLQELDVLLEKQGLDLCLACKWIVETVKHGLGSDRNPGLIRRPIRDMCELGTDTCACKGFVNRVFNTLVRLMSRTTDDAPLICYIVSACK